MPGSTPTMVPMSAPRKHARRLPGVRATPRPATAAHGHFSVGGSGRRSSRHPHRPRSAPISSRALFGVEGAAAAPPDTSHRPRSAPMSSRALFGVGGSGRRSPRRPPPASIRVDVLTRGLWRRGERPASSLTPPTRLRSASMSSRAVFGVGGSERAPLLPDTPTGLDPRRCPHARFEGGGSGHRSSLTPPTGFDPVDALTRGLVGGAAAAPPDAPLHSIRADVLTRGPVRVGGAAAAPPPTPPTGLDPRRCPHARL